MVRRKENYPLFTRSNAIQGVEEARERDRGLVPSAERMREKIDCSSAELYEIFGHIPVFAGLNSFVECRVDIFH